jgi:cytochrome c
MSLLRIRRPLVAALAALPLAPLQAQSPAPAGDAAAGGLSFMQCADCHSTTGANGVGPGLRGVVGRHAGAAADFSYSAAMKKEKAALVWDAKTLDTFLANPKAMVPGTSMDFPGIADAADRANLVAYLATLK